jgi:hypothetical protein
MDVSYFFCGKRLKGRLSDYFVGYNTVLNIICLFGRFFIKADYTLCKLTLGRNVDHEKNGATSTRL